MNLKDGKNRVICYIAGVEDLNAPAIREAKRMLDDGTGTVSVVRVVDVTQFIAYVISTRPVPKEWVTTLWKRWVKMVDDRCGKTHREWWDSSRASRSPDKYVMVVNPKNLPVPPVPRMTQEEIRVVKQALDAEERELDEKRKLNHAKRQALHTKCGHPNRTVIFAAGSEYDSSCPDCGWAYDPFE